MTIEQQRAKLALWIREWNLEGKLSGADGDDIPVEPTAPASGAGDCTDPKSGDVILLPPVGATTFSRPVYMLLVRRHWMKQWIAVPFSRFSVPATDGELATDREFLPIKVLSLWNHGKIDEATVRKSWRVASISPADVSLASEYIAGRKHQLPDSRTGAPIVRGCDPRLEYMDEERAIWFDLSASDSASDESSSYAFGGNDSFLAEAAEKGDDDDRPPSP